MKRAVTEDNDLNYIKRVKVEHISSTTMDDLPDDVSIIFLAENVRIWITAIIKQKNNNSRS